MMSVGVLLVFLLTLLASSGDAWLSHGRIRIRRGLVLRGVVRPSRDDVDRISWGKPARSKGVGSRGVPHRLNDEERTLFELAKKKGFVEVAGSGWRAERRDAPLVNMWRSWCDAVGGVAIVVHKSRDGLADEVVVDLSPLRRPADFDALAAACSAALGAPSDVIRFDSAPEVEDHGEDLGALAADAEAWNSRRIYQLPRCDLSWAGPRAHCKTLAKHLVTHFDFPIASKGAPLLGARRKAPAVKPGKSRRSGGYGIG